MNDYIYFTVVDNDSQYRYKGKCIDMTMNTIYKARRNDVIDHPGYITELSNVDVLVRVFRNKEKVIRLPNL